MSLTSEVLAAQDASTTAAIIAMCTDAAASASGVVAEFAALSAKHAAKIAARDAEDDVKLRAGIQISIDSGAIEAQPTPPTYARINVAGKTPDVVVADIVAQLPDGFDASGGVIVIVGLSGTGKGTTVAKLKVRVHRAARRCLRDRPPPPPHTLRRLLPR